MKKWTTSIAVLAMVFGSMVVAVNEDGGGGGGVYTKRSPDELRQLLQDYRTRREVLRRATSEPAPSQTSTTQSAALTEEQEMLQLQQLSFEAQVARLAPNGAASAR